MAGRVEWVPLVHAVALPGGPVERETFERIREELIGRIREAGPLDGLRLRHPRRDERGRAHRRRGRTGRRRTRRPPGPARLISAAMDLHGNVSREFARQLDLLTAHRLAPHEDAWETRERAARNLVARLAGGAAARTAPGCRCRCCCPARRPAPGWSPPSRLYGALAGVEALEGITTRRSGWVTPGPTSRAAAPRSSSPVTTPHSSWRRPARWPAATGRRAHDFAFVGPTGQLDECVAEAASARPARS